MNINCSERKLFSLCRVKSIRQTLNCFSGFNDNALKRSYLKFSSRLHTITENSSQLMSSIFLGELSRLNRLEINLKLPPSRGWLMEVPKTPLFIYIVPDVLIYWVYDLCDEAIVWTRINLLYSIDCQQLHCSVSDFLTIIR